MRNRPFSALDAVLEDALKKLELQDAAYEARVVMMWPQVVGPQFARATEAVKMQGSTLIVHARSSAWSQEVGFQKQVLLRKIGERLGREFVKDIRCQVRKPRATGAATQAPAPPDAEIRRIRLDDAEIARIRAASESDDPELSQAIRRALTHEAQIRAWHLAHGAKACPRCGAAHRTTRSLCPACRRDDALRDIPG